MFLPPHLGHLNLYQSHKGWTSNDTFDMSLVRLDEYQSHKGWTSNLYSLFPEDWRVMYQSHKGWTSNVEVRNEHVGISNVSIPQGVDVKLWRTITYCQFFFVSIPQGVDVKLFLFSNVNYSMLSINPTRGGRQTISWMRKFRHLHLCINPTRGGRQTGALLGNCVLSMLYQSHKGWTSNDFKSGVSGTYTIVSIPQGVDVKLQRRVL